MWSLGKSDEAVICAKIWLWVMSDESAMRERDTEA